MNINNLERANILAKSLIPKIDALLYIGKCSKEKAGESLTGLLKNDEEFRNKFVQILLETKQRLQKEFDEL